MPLEDAYRALRDRLTGEARTREPMSRHTTYRIGGPADLYVVCDTLVDLKLTLRVLHDEGVEHAVLGKGSNVLVADEGFRGAVVTLGREFRRHRFEEERVEAGAACVLAQLVQEAYSKGRTGLEFAVGIPGTLGGALEMNAGTRDVWMQNVVESVTLYSRESGLIRLRGPEVSWGYRRSGLHLKGVVLEAVLAVRAGDPVGIRRVMEANFLRRKKSQPVGMPCAGSVFVNPPNDSAGRLIEASGLKGVAVGGARVSDVHANFIVNAGAATARDVARLIRLVTETVEREQGVRLSPEIRFLGEFPEG